MNKYVITGMIISLSLISTLSGCSQQTQAEITPTIEIETTVVETTVEESTTQAETSIASMGKYGEYGKEAYDLLVSNWLEWLYADEGELRLNATAMLGSISEENYEAIIAEILAMDRGSNPYADLQAEAQGGSQSTQPTQSVQSTEPVQSESKSSIAETKSQPEPQQTTPAPQPQVNDTPPAAISQEEEDAIWEEAGLGGTPNVTISDGISLDPNAGEGYNWH